MDTSIRIRPAAVADAADIARIYNDAIRARTATFETRERTPDEIGTWLGSPRHPLLVALAGDEVVGWVAASSYRERECYSGIVEFSVYVAAHARRQGVGDALMHAFLPAVAASGAWKIVSRIFPENTASLALCARHGFRQVGTYRRHARLDGVWRDVVIVERLIDQDDVAHDRS